MSIDTPRQEYDPDLDFQPSDDPFALFAEWFETAKQDHPGEVNAMSLATANAEGQPSVRMVLLKGASEKGFQFFTNLGSRKAQEISSQSAVALCFYWGHQNRQIRIRGTAQELARSEVDAYFQTRPRGAQCSAWVSSQSQLLASREQLASEFNAFDKKHAGDQLQTPGHWGGYLVIPEEFEFWQGALNRMHQRLQFQQNTEKTWSHRWLYP